MRRILSVIFLVALGTAAYIYRAPLRVFAAQIYGQALPCSRPITFSIGSIDPSFDISQEDVLSAVEGATHIWDAAAGRTLFTYVPTGGTVRVNLVYDDRQQTTEKLKSIGVSISSDKASYDKLNAEYSKMLATYAEEKNTFEAQSASLERNVASYEQEVAQVNGRGGATPAEFAALQQKKAALETERSQLLTLQKKVNTDADDVNAVAQTLNRVAHTVNQAASTYNDTARTTGEEFEEAVFESTPGKEDINVYEFDSSTRLTRVLAHEFGHALGLDHVEDPSAIMYRLNQSTNDKPTDADIGELKVACRVR